jgi:hypothetical protein
MADEPKSKRRPEIAHVLFIDIGLFQIAHHGTKHADSEGGEIVYTHRAASNRRSRGEAIAFTNGTVARRLRNLEPDFELSKLPKHCGTIQIFASAWAFTAGLKSPIK